MALVSGSGQPVSIPFFVYDVDGVTPVTGLPNTAFAKTLIANGAVSAQPVVVNEIGSGFYTVNFTPDSVGLWDVTVVTPDEEIWGAVVQVGEYHPHEALARIQKTAWNRLEVDLAAQELVLWDDAGTTIIQRWPLQTDAGMPGDPVATQPGVQTKRKVPLLP